MVYSTMLQVHFLSPLTLASCCEHSHLRKPAATDGLALRFSGGVKDSRTARGLQLPCHNAIAWICASGSLAFGSFGKNAAAQSIELKAGYGGPGSANLRFRDMCMDLEIHCWRATHFARAWLLNNYITGFCLEHCLLLIVSTGPW